MEALQSIWPGAGWESMPDGMNGSESVQLVPETTLRGTRLSRVIDQALQGDPSDLSWLQRAEELPDFRTALHERLYSDSSVLKSPSGFAMLCRVLEGHDEIDLTPCPNLGASETLHVIRRLVQSRAAPVRSIILPDIDNLTLDTITDTISLTNTGELHLGETCNISLKDLLNMARSTGLQTFTCATLYKRALDLLPFTHCKYDYKTRTSSFGFPCGLNTGFPLNRLICLRQPHIPTVERLDNGGVRWTLQTPESSINKWRHNRLFDMKERTAAILVVPLRDALLSYEGLVQRLPQLLERLVSVGDMNLMMPCVGKGTVGMGVAQQLVIDVWSGSNCDN